MKKPEVPAWMPAPAHPEEAARLARLRRYEILDSPPEASFERITRVAAHTFDVPIVLVSLVDDARQWFKSRHGLDTDCTHRDESFCAYTILLDEEEELFVVPDTASDPRFAENPMVVSEPYIRFYCGARLRTADGWNLGSLCLIDTRSRELSTAEGEVLIDLAGLTMDIINARYGGAS